MLKINIEKKIEEIYKKCAHEMQKSWDNAEIDHRFDMSWEELEEKLKNDEIKRLKKYEKLRL